MVKYYPVRELVPHSNSYWMYLFKLLILEPHMGNFFSRSEHIGTISYDFILETIFGKMIILGTLIGANMGENTPIWVIFVTSVVSGLLNH
jgi:hypothetical protein